MKSVRKNRQVLRGLTMWDLLLLSAEENPGAKGQSGEGFSQCTSKQLRDSSRSQLKGYATPRVLSLA